MAVQETVTMANKLSNQCRSQRARADAVSVYLGRESILDMKQAPTKTYWHMAHWFSQHSASPNYILHLRHKYSQKLRRRLISFVSVPSPLMISRSALIRRVKPHLWIWWKLYFQLIISKLLLQHDISERMNPPLRPPACLLFGQLHHLRTSVRKSHFSKHLLRG